MKQTYQQVRNCLNVMLETINQRAKAVDVLVNGNCIEEAILIASELASVSNGVKTMLMDFDLTQDDE